MVFVELAYIEIRICHSDCWRGISRPSRYIGRLCLDIGMVPGEFGNIPEYQEVVGTPEKYMGLIGP